MQLEFPRKIFEKYSNTKFNENRSNESRVIPCGLTDRRNRYDKANSHFSKFCERA